MRVGKHQSDRGSPSLESVYKHASNFFRDFCCTIGGVHISNCRVAMYERSHVVAHIRIRNYQRHHRSALVNLSLMQNSFDLINN
ncbi:MAG: hypothetical protein ACJAYF_003818 [Arenicella sp.]|jgi:hypothetical protein